MVAQCYPLPLFLVMGSLLKTTNPKKGALMIMWLLGYPGKLEGSYDPVA